jgi:hypothetical protein
MVLRLGVAVQPVRCVALTAQYSDAGLTRKVTFTGG